MMNNKYPYNNWKSITESDFVTLFIKTWFAFVSTLREMYPAEIPYYQATGETRFVKVCFLRKTPELQKISNLALIIRSCIFASKKFYFSILSQNSDTRRLKIRLIMI